MVDFRKIFEYSFNLIKNDKKIILPIFLLVLIPFIITVIFLFASGTYPLLREINVAYQDFGAQKVDFLTDKENIKDENYTLELISYLSKGSGSSPYNDQFGDYLTQQGFEYKRFLELLTPNNIAIGIFSLILIIISSIYFSVMSYTMISLRILKNTSDLISTTNSFILKFISVKILLIIIFWAPLLLILAGFLSPKYAIFMVVILVILYIIFLIFMSFKLFFTLPSMFLENLSSTKSIKNSYTITKGRILQVFFILVIIMGIGIFINSFIGKPFFNIVGSFLYGVGIINIFINFLLFLLFLVLDVTVITFQRIFIFYAYIDFKKGGGKKMVDMKNPVYVGFWMRLLMKIPIPIMITKIKKTCRMRPLVIV